jgi:phage terminase Nu1 subunit (DNA packaging protein)
VAPLERYVDARELAELMGVSPSTIKRWVAAGMPSETWGMNRTRRFLPSQAMTWARNRTTISPTGGDCDSPPQLQPKE